ncbi:MAG: DNA gyrase modulator, partial [Bacillota bacterium]
MMGADELRSMAEAGLQEAGSLSAEIHLESYRYDLTRFAEGQIHQNISMDGIHVTVRVFSGRKRGEVTLSAPGTERVKKAVRRAVEALEQGATGPERPMPGPDAGYLPDGDAAGFDEKVETRGVDWRAQTAEKVVQVIEREGPRSFGRVATEVNERLIVNSEGLVSYAPRTACDLVLATIRGTGYGYSERHSFSLEG